MGVKSRISTPSFFYISYPETFSKSAGWRFCEWNSLTRYFVDEKELILSFVHGYRLICGVFDENTLICLCVDGNTLICGFVDGNTLICGFVDGNTLICGCWWKYADFWLSMFCWWKYADMWLSMEIRWFVVVDGIMGFGDYFKKYARYEDEPKSENGEHRSVFASLCNLKVV